jgi:hypothetical protein
MAKSLLIDIDYQELLNYCSEYSGYRTLVNFFEICLVLNKARPAAIVNIESDNVAKINEMFERFGVQLYNLNMELNKNTCLIVDWTSPLNNEREVNKLISSFHYDPNHVLMGKILGYMSSIDIMKNRNTSTEKSIQISIDVFDRKTSKENNNIQLVPQIAQDKSDDEIRAYYEPMIVVLRKLQSYIPSIIIKSIQVKITPYGVHTSFESLNRSLMMKLLMKQKTDINGDWSILLNQYMRNASKLRESENNAAGSSGGRSRRNARRQRKTRRARHIF